MGLAGRGAVAIWHDIAPEGREEFYAWHGIEHMPERVAIPGFLRGRRYVASAADLEFFNLYEARDHATVTGPDYAARLNAPTPWTLKAVKHFRSVARSICRVAVSLGRGEGGLAATVRYDVEDASAEAHLASMRDRLLPGLAAQPGIAGVHLLVADAEASAVENAERKARAEPNRIPRWIVVVEGWGDEAPFAAFCQDQLTLNQLLAPGVVGTPQLGLYRLQAVCQRPLAGEGA
ncbi:MULTISPECIES: hypothetical protein [Chelatococcus]|uniref:Uncharacterized protein n=1 Tax=Chelatococcus caeni TaxID=1348468 RepID=A0A840C2T7_9HYPH|nr:MULTISPECIES: hypothetical protein [Chelatococcus]ALA17978.1 hypothetical protein AL346_11890 [Chelatococcus sp. CO-6]MBB4019934.1 hypothetical protein [Chelatococcus caeni]